MPIVRNGEALTDENLRRILSYSLAFDYDIEIDGEFIKDEADKKTKTEPLFFQDSVCPNKYGFSLRIADRMVKLDAAVDNHNFIRNAEGGEDARKQAVTSLKRALKAKGVNIAEDGNDSVISFSREQLITNDFLKTTPMGEVDIFLDKIKTDAAAREKLAKDILAIANDLDHHIDKSEDIEKIRAHRKKQFEEGDGTKGSKVLPEEGYEKSVYTYPKQSGGDEGYPEGVIKHKRVKIPDSPFWISIDVVNGEFVIATQEDRMYLGNTSQQMVDLKDALEKNIVFKKVFDAAKKKDSDMVYEGRRIYFAQNAFNELKNNKEAAIKKVDEASADQEEAKSNKLIVDRFSFYKTKAALKAVPRVLGKIPHTLITATNLQFLPCEDADRFQMTIVNENKKILQSSPKETYVKLKGNFAEQLQPQTKNPSGAFQPYGARFEWMHFQEIEGGQKIFGKAYLLNAKFNNCVFENVDFSDIPKEALNSISFKGCLFTNCKPEGIEKRNKDIKNTGLKAEVEEVRGIVNAIADPDATWQKAQENLVAVREARKAEVPKPKVSAAKYESVGVELTNLVDKFNQLKDKHKTR